MQELCDMDKRLREIQDSQIETKTYVQTILEDIKELKTSIKDLNVVVRENAGSDSKSWQPVVTELIKLVSVSIAILGTVVGAIKMSGA